jgi:hypothetical protein
LDNGKCDCGPFYTGESCGTFVDCKDDLGETLCNTLVHFNQIDKSELPNSNVEDGDTDGGELEPSKENFIACKSDCRKACRGDCKIRFPGRKNKAIRNECINLCKPHCKLQCLHLRPTTNNTRTAEVARIKTSSETTDGSKLLESKNEILNSNHITITTSVALVVLQFLLR